MQNYLYKKTFLIKTNFAVNWNLKSTRRCQVKNKDKQKSSWNYISSRALSWTLMLPKALSSTFWGGINFAILMRKTSLIRLSRTTRVQQKKSVERWKAREFANEIEIHGFVEQKVAENEVAVVLVPRDSDALSFIWSGRRCSQSFNPILFIFHAGRLRWEVNSSVEWELSYVRASKLCLIHALRRFFHVI